MTEKEAREMDCPSTAFKEKCRLWKCPLFIKGEKVIRQDDYSMYDYEEQHYYCGLGGKYE